MGRCMPVAAQWAETPRRAEAASRAGLVPESRLRLPRELARLLMAKGRCEGGMLRELCDAAIRGHWGMSAAHRRLAPT